MSIRRAEPSDAPLLAALNRYVHEPHVKAEPSVYRATDLEELTAWFRERLEGEQFEFFVAEQDGVAVGFIGLQHRPYPRNPFAHARRIVMVDQIAVDPAARRQGIGRRLMEAVHEHVGDLDSVSIELDVRAFNEGALAFYRSLGYEVAMLRMVRST